MQKVIDPVCGMSIDSTTAAGQSKFEGRDYYFCSKACQAEFEKNPSKYRHADATSGTASTTDDDPRFTKVGEIVSPKFGAAGSGGAEYEPLPHDRSSEGGGGGR